MIFETHAHYDDAAFDEDRDSLLPSLPEAGIGKVVNVGASLASCRKTMEIMGKYPFVYGALGVHPSETAELNEENFAWLRDALLHEKCVAVGEIGLDYYWPEPDRDTQKIWFRRQLNLARELHKPVIIHSRDAAQDTMEILRQERAEEIGGVVHCFSYSVEIAETAVKMGFYIGVGGVLTFKNAAKIKEVVKKIPLDRIVLETDCPYLSPEPFRGKRNSSLYIPYVVEKIAELKQVSAEEVEDIIWKNAEDLYGLSKK